MNAFERHGITHLSPSSLLTFRANAPLWVGKYLYGWKDEGGPGAFRGSAVEAGLDVWLYGERDNACYDNAIARTLDTFAELSSGQADPEWEEERDSLQLYLKQACEATKDWPLPDARQLKVEHYLDGIEVPVIGYLDYQWPEFGLDLKTTKRLPSSIKADHACQVALYSHAKQRPWKVLYATPKKSALYEQSPTEAESALKELAQIARAVRHLLNKSDNRDDARMFFAPDYENFRWSSQTHQLAQEIYG